MLEPLPKVFLTRLAMTENFPKLPQMQWCLVCPSEGDLARWQVLGNRMSGQFEATFRDATRSATIWLGLGSRTLLHLARPGPTNEARCLAAAEWRKRKTGGQMRSSSGNVGVEVGGAANGDHTC